MKKRTCIVCGKRGNFKNVGYYCDECLDKMELIGDVDKSAEQKLIQLIGKQTRCDYILKRVFLLLLILVMILHFV